MATLAIALKTLENVVTMAVSCKDYFTRKIANRYRDVSGGTPKSHL